jgi:hypothetical protein
MTEEELEGIKQQFKWAVQALVQPADVQPTLFPSFVAVADELALDFGNWWLVFRDHFGDSCTAAQRRSAEALDELLDEMSGPGKAELWVEKGCLNHPKWSKVRELAEIVLSTFGWSADIPPAGRSLYARYTGGDK